MFENYQTILFNGPDDHGVLVATLNRPERLNALIGQSWDELHRLCDDVRSDDRVRVVILTGAGRGFCAGLDLGDASGLPGRTVVGMWRGQTHGAAAIAAIHRLPVPVIAAVNGPAAGGGLALALAADVRIAAPSAKFGVAFIRLGLSACDVGVSWLLPRIVGLGAASELMLTGRVVDADHALRIGLVNDLSDDVLGAARAVAEEMARNAPFGLELTKEGLRLAVDAPSLEAAIAIENRNQVLASRTADMRAAVEAFVNKTDPTFTGS